MPTRLEQNGVIKTGQREEARRQVHNLNSSTTPTASIHTSPGQRPTAIELSAESSIDYLFDAPLVMVGAI